MRKPGLLKRLFSFGSKAEEETAETTAEEKASVSDEILAPSSEVEKTSKDAIKDNTNQFVNQRPDKVGSPEMHQFIPAIDSLPEQPLSPVESTGQSDANNTGSVQIVQEEEDESLEITVRSPPAPSTASDNKETVIDSATKQFANLGDSEPSEPVKTGSQIDRHIIAKPAVAPKGEKPAELAEKVSWFERLSLGLSRSSSQLSENIASVFNRKKLDDAALEELEDILLQADLGVDTTLKIVDSLAKQRIGKVVNDVEVRGILAEEIEKVLSSVAMPLELDLDHKPHVILVVGVNGSGKTTTIGKLSQKLNDGGYSTMLVAGDTFRAAAIEQLQIWGDRTHSKVIARPLGSDSSGLAYDAWQQAKEQECDVLMMDTAGRLQNRTELMAELTKIIKVMKKQDANAPHTVLLTLDATTGQNALNQVEIFGKIAGVNGLIMTKLDGSARGGILVAISAKYQLPVYFVGVGEQVEDLEPFEARDFARSIAGLKS